MKIFKIVLIILSILAIVGGYGYLIVYNGREIQKLELKIVELEEDIEILTKIADLQADKNKELEYELYKQNRKISGINDEIHNKYIRLLYNDLKILKLIRLKSKQNTESENIIHSAF